MELYEEGGLLSTEILQAIKELGFEKPTEIQSQAIPFLLNETRDLIGLAQTGTGKTAAFGLPLISQIDFSKNVPQALVICPTRELCLQIERDLTNYGKYLPLQTVAVYGGADIVRQIKKIQSGVHIVVATPGRLVDIISRKKVDLSQVKNLVLDEADEMLDMGFQEDLDSILEQTPAEKRTLLFSATMPAEVRRIASNYMNDPHEITIGTKNSGAVTVSHQAYIVSSKNRYIALKRIADYYPDIYGIVFCRTREETKDVADKLMSDGYSADALHGDLSQAQRDYVMKKFRNKNLNMLVATDVAARGLDVHDLTHVINYSIPDDLETYTHRSGRTGRAGKEGISILIANLREKGKLKRIEQIIKKKIEIKKVPGGQEICAVQMKDLIQKVLSTEVNEEKLNTLLTPIIHQFEGMSSEDILKHFVSFEVNRILEYYENAPDINLDVEKENERRRNLEERNRERGERRRRERENRERGDRRDREDRPNRNERRSRERGRDEGRSYTRFFVNIGKKEQLDQSKLLRLLNEHANDRDIHYGAIDIMRSFTFFEVESKYTDKILRSLENAKYEGMPVSVQVAQAPKQPELPAKNKKHDDFRDGRRGGDFRGGRGFGKSKRGGDRRFDRDRGNKKGRRRDF
ncbi:MAG: DEAD/DEAH box helicase [Bacteroidales bacterium]|jgi:ATP-dependent RNA helicase DeaD|nr:DEAD/DEAH box helicase [Bacteroidales bacterium]